MPRIQTDADLQCWAQPDAIICRVSESGVFSLDAYRGIRSSMQRVNKPSAIDRRRWFRRARKSNLSQLNGHRTTRWLSTAATRQLRVNKLAPIVTPFYRGHDAIVWAMADCILIDVCAPSMGTKEQKGTWEANAKDRKHFKHFFSSRSHHCGTFVGSNPLLRESWWSVPLLKCDLLYLFDLLLPESWIYVDRWRWWFIPLCYPLSFLFGPLTNAFSSSVYRQMHGCTCNINHTSFTVLSIAGPSGSQKATVDPGHLTS